MNYMNIYRAGFTFLEVVIAITVMGLLLTTLVQLQTSLISISGDARDRYTRAVNIWNAYVYAQRQPWYQQKQQSQEAFYTDDMMTYSYAQATIDEQSVLAPYTQMLVREDITGRDEDNNEHTLVMYRYQPKEQEASE